MSKPIIITTTKIPAETLPDPAQLQQLARWMDSAFEVPGTDIRFGLDAIIGLVPGLGDLVTSLVALHILRTASRYGVPRVTLARMGLNIAVDSIIGAVPFVGDAFDVYWKSNIRNVELLQRHLSSVPGEARRARAGDWLFIAGLILLLLAVLAGSITVVFLIWQGLSRLWNAPQA